VGAKPTGKNAKRSEGKLYFTHKIVFLASYSFLACDNSSSAVLSGLRRNNRGQQARAAVYAIDALPVFDLD
jgi:hypothetical protein